MKKKLILILLITTSFIYKQSLTFETLTQAKKFAEENNEFPKPDNNDHLNPNHSLLHKKSNDNIFDKILSFLQIKKQLWNPAYFKKILTKITKKRELNSYTGKFILKTTPPIGSKYLIFGDLHGAFHSLVRILNKLEQLGIINDKFKIIKPNYNLLFNGDFINRSPFILETLTLVFKLLEQNPKKVFYIKGNHEVKHTWYNLGLRRELQIRCRSVSNEKLPLSTLIHRFLNTLPHALYIKSQVGIDNEFVLISHYGKIDNEAYKFLNTDNLNKIDIFNLKNKKPSKEKIIVKSIIKSESRSTTYQFTDGLKLLNSEQGITTWGVFSCPTNSGKILYNFDYDAYAELTVGGNINTWTIAVYNKKLKPYCEFSTKKFILLSGQMIYENFNVQPDKKYYKEQIIDLKNAISPIVKKIKKLK